MIDYAAAATTYFATQSFNYARLVMVEIQLIYVRARIDFFLWQSN